MKYIRDIFNSKKIISFIMSSISYSILCFQGILKYYSLLSWLVYLIMFIVFYNADIYNKKYRKEIIKFSVLFSVLTVFGEIAYNLQYSKDLSIFRVFLTIKSFAYLVGTFNIFFIIFTYLFPKMSEFRLKQEKNNKSSKFIFIISFIIIFICWLPYFLRFFPGTLSPDSFSELSTIVNNFNVVSDHHPVLHILFVAGPYNIGYHLFDSMKIGIAFATITQMIILASIFSYFITFLHKRNVNKNILLLILIYYAIFPMHGYYSIVMWKDVIFSGLLLLLTIEVFKILEYSSNNVIKLCNLKSLIVISILCIFFRNNAVYMYVIFAIFALFVFRNNKKPFIISFIIIFGIYGLIKGPVFSYFNVIKSESAEYIGMPLQQIGRMAYKNVDFTVEERQKLNELMDVELMAESYNPKVSDGIKFNKNYHKEVFDNNKSDYAKLWLTLVVKHPGVALEAYTISTLGYWYPGVEYWSVANTIWENDYGLEVSQKVPNIVRKYIDCIESRSVPIVNMEWSIGLCFWIILIFSHICKKNRGKKYLLVYVPVFGIWVTMMIASPVFAEFRYVYGAFTCLPLLMITPYLNLNDKVYKK